MRLPKRKNLRLENYNYASNGAYFITVCIRDTSVSLWQNTNYINQTVGANCVRPQNYILLSKIGQIIESEILKINSIYDNVIVDKYCIMPDHIHMIIFLDGCNNKFEQTQFAPTISRVIKQFKGSITKQIGHNIWQKAFNDHIIRNEKSYIEIWKYVDQNPEKYIFEKH